MQQLKASCERLRHTPTALTGPTAEQDVKQRALPADDVGAQCGALGAAAASKQHQAA